MTHWSPVPSPACSRGGRAREGARPNTCATGPGVDAAGYKGRNVVERCGGPRLKRMRRIGTRYEKLAANYAAMLTRGMAVL